MTLSSTDRNELKAIFKDIINDIPCPDGDINRQRMNNLEELVKSNKVFIDGNGKEGAKVSIPLMQKDIATLKYDIGILRSDVREILNRLRGKTGETLFQKILPGLVEKLIIVVVTIFVALTVSHWLEIFPP